MHQSETLFFDIAWKKHPCSNISSDKEQPKADADYVPPDKKEKRTPGKRGEHNNKCFIWFYYYV